MPIDPDAFLLTVFGVTVVGCLTKVVLAFVNRKSARALSPTDVLARLERIEHTVEATAVEVERLGEGLRFLTRLSSEAPPQAVEAPRAPLRVTTPR